MDFLFFLFWLINSEVGGDRNVWQAFINGSSAHDKLRWKFMDDSKKSRWGIQHIRPHTPPISSSDN